jgi:hypothetical protein
MAHQVPAIILEQLGGNRFKIMTGAKDFVGSATALHFSLPRGKKFKIELIDDLYTLTYYKWNRKAFNLDVIETVEGVYNDDLQTIFTNMTGLYTKL